MSKPPNNQKSQRMFPKYFKMENNPYIVRSKKWIEQFVIALNLCPFAGVPFRKDKIRYVLVEDELEETLVRSLLEELAFLCETSAIEVETTLMIYPNALSSFSDYNNFLGIVETLLEQAGLNGILQIASFHPDYCFAAAPADDPANYTNRSPFPMLHLLREESITKVVGSYPDTAAIPENNMQLLRKMGKQKIEELYQNLRNF